MARSKYSDIEKGTVVRLLLSERYTPKELSETLNISSGTISSWKREIEKKNKILNKNKILENKVPLKIEDLVQIDAAGLL